tara:strand:- start:2241 stop:2993 length:753 start_codon:yes stop_codon:yes gene_type:complete
MIELKEVKKSFGNKVVLKGISALFEKGKTNLVIGGSGSGKTVTLKSMVGLITPDSGEILFDGRNMVGQKDKAKKLIRKDIGMLFQGSALFDSLTVEENIMFPLNMFAEKLSESEKLDRVNHCLERVQLPDVNQLYPAELSGGMQKRVGIARAIVNNPKYLFVDEPNSGLDPRTSIVIDQLISELTKELNTTTVINTHDMNSVMEIGEKIIYLHKGTKWWEGDNSSILETDNEELNSFIFASKFLDKLRQK